MPEVIADRPERRPWALRYVNQADVRALFEELRSEEAEHVRMIQEIIKKLPPESKLDVEDQDDTSMRMGY